MKKWIWFIAGSISVSNSMAQTAAINREEVVRRHTIQISKPDPLASLTVGNGQFAFTADVTGLQSFPAYYQKGVPLGTQNEWGWHSFPNTEKYRREETLKEYELNGKKITYCVQVKEPERSRKAVDYFRVNPHRLQLGNIGLEITKKDGALATIEDIQNIDQQLDMWTGELTSKFTVEGVPVVVSTFAHQEQDGIAVQINSPLLGEKRLAIRLHFPYPNGEFKDVGTFEGDSTKHRSELYKPAMFGGAIRRTLDTTTYFVQYTFTRASSVRMRRQHDCIIQPPAGNTFEASFYFAPAIKQSNAPSFAETKTNSTAQWMSFWKSGGAIDFSASTNEKANELERRIVLSQYLTKV